VADFDLASKVIDQELPGVLAWAMEGVRLYLEHGLEDELSRKLYRDWTISVDPVELFIDECVEFTHHRDYLERPEIWKRFQQFCTDSENKPVKKGDFFARFLKDHRFGKPAKVHGVVRLSGARWCI
jgi:phage/plasmid-associated DNA primase